LSSKTILQVFFLGMLISFLGALPLGTLNIAAMQIGISESIPNAFLFSAGSIVVEMIYVRISLQGLAWMTKQEKLMKALEIFTLLIVIALCIFSFYNAQQTQSGEKTVSLIPWMNRFLLGTFMSAINPVQIPFWFGWSTVLFEKKLLNPNPKEYLWYISGIGIGSLIGNGVFIFGGRIIASKINNNLAYLNYTIAGIFGLTAILQIIKMYRKRTKSKSLQNK
jgi:threonine/homoserine/homoserine lactone efflux protein